MALALKQGKRLELEAVNGTIRRLGRAKGVPTPINDVIYPCLKPYLDGNAHHQERVLYIGLVARFKRNTIPFYAYPQGDGTVVTLPGMEPHPNNGVFSQA